MRRIKNALIQSTMLGFEDYGLLTFFLNTIHEEGSQRFGGWSLTGPACPTFIQGILKTIGVRKWEDLPGKYCRVDGDYSKILRIGHITEDRWFEPGKDV